MYILFVPCLSEYPKYDDNIVTKITISYNILAYGHDYYIATVKTVTAVFLYHWLAITETTETGVSHGMSTANTSRVSWNVHSQHITCLMECPQPTHHVTHGMSTANTSRVSWNVHSQHITCLMECPQPWTLPTRHASHESHWCTDNNKCMARCLYNNY